MMKKIIAGAMLALPLVVTSLPTKASATDVIVNPHVHNFPSAPVTISYRHRHRVYIRGHWEGFGRHRHYIPGHWVWVD